MFSIEDRRKPCQDFLPLEAENWITCGNALRLDWLSICPPTGTVVKHQADDLFHTPLDQAQIEFENQGGETYICGNPPYTGYNRQSESQKEDIVSVFEGRAPKFGNLDYVCCWFAKSALMNRQIGSKSAFVATNSICQGSQAPIIWPFMFKEGQKIFFARTSFRWSNLAARNAGITVIVVGIQSSPAQSATLFQEVDGEPMVSACSHQIQSKPSFAMPRAMTQQAKQIVLGGAASDDQSSAWARSSRTSIPNSTKRIRKPCASARSPP